MKIVILVLIAFVVLSKVAPPIAANDKKWIKSS